MAELDRHPLLLLLLLHWSVLLHCLPFSPSLIAIERAPASPDLLLPAVCPSKCKEKFGAVRSTPTQGHCACQCPPEAPLFLTTEGVCVRDLAECEHSVHFSSPLPAIAASTNTTTTTSSSSASSSAPPTIRLPARGGILNANNPLRWKEAGLNKLNGCVVRGVYADNAEHSWRPLDVSLFLTERAQNTTVIKWVGSDGDASSLEGCALQIQLECPGERHHEVCIALRVAGRSEVPSTRAVVAGSAPRSSLAILIVLCVLVFLSFFGSFVVSKLCWRLKEDRMRAEIQHQFLMLIKQQQEDGRKAAAMAMAAQQQAAQHMSFHSSGALSQSEFAPPPPTPPLQQVPVQKRKLFFSTDFLEPHLMLNPPPVAEQFLFDLRKMIDMAKERIRLRRHVPQLMSIIEEHDESFRASPCPPRCSPLPSFHGASEEKVEQEEEEEEVVEEPHEGNSSKCSQDSPRSGKSVDSGHETFESGDSSESKDSSESSGDEDRTEAKEGGERSGPTEGAEERKPGSVRRIVDGFESASVTRPQSRIPTLSPRTATRHLALPSSAASPPTTHLPTGPPPLTPNACKRTKNKGYAVFPVDPMLKKSLPRRPKREIPRLNKDN